MQTTGKIKDHSKGDVAVDQYHRYKVYMVLEFTPSCQLISKIYIYIYISLMIL